MSNGYTDYTEVQTFMQVLSHLKEGYCIKHTILEV